MRRFESRSEQTICSAGERGDERVDVGRADADERAAARGSRGVATVAPSSSSPSIRRVAQPGDVLLDRGRAGLLDDRHPGEAAVDVRHRRRARRRSGARRPPASSPEMSIWKMSSSANQPVWVGSSPPSSSRAHVEEAEPRRGEQVLDRAAGDEVDAERARVEVDRADRLVRVGEAERARVVRDPRDLGDVVAVAGAVGDGRAADERRPLVDRLGEALRRDRPVRLGPDVDDLGAAQLLRVRDLADRRELVLADHDLRPLAASERQRADDAVDALADRGGDRDLARLGLEQPRERRARRLGPLDPVPHSAPFSSQPSRYSS